MIWLYPLFIGLALCQALIMRRMGMTWGKIHLSACYAAWGIGWLITVLWWLDSLTYWWLSSLFVVCFPVIYWGYIPVQKMKTTDRLNEIIRHINILFSEVDNFARNFR